MQDGLILIDSLPTVIRVSEEEPPAHFSIQAGENHVRPVMLTNLRQVYVFLITADRSQAPAIINLSHKIVQSLGDDLRDVVLTMMTLIKHKFPGHDTKITVMIDSQVKKDEAKKFRDCGIHGLIPTLRDFGWQPVQYAYEVLLKTGTSHWPKEFIESSTKHEKPNKSDKIELTDRQQEVQKLLCERGLSNKAIARQLSISESTVKIHVSAILKRYGVRNRTQLALAVNNGARL